MSQPALDRQDIEKNTHNVNNNEELECRPTISAIDIYYGGDAKRVEQYPRSLRENEAQYAASLPPLAAKSTRIYLKEEDCSERDAFSVQTARILGMCKQEIQAIFQLFPDPDLSPDLFECAIARFLEKSGADCWDLVHKVDRFDIGDLRNLFDDQQRDSPGFLVQVNMEASQLHQRAVPGPLDDRDSTRRTLYAGRFGGDSMFLEKYAALRICESKVEDAFEVHCIFPAFSYAGLPQTLAEEYLFPLLVQFEQLICSSDSSVPSNNSDPTMIQTYIILDYLRCVTQSWLSFMKRVGHVSRPAALLQSQHDNDINVTTSIRNAVNDLQSCVTYVLDRGAVLNDSTSTEHPVVEERKGISSRKHLLMIQDLRAQLDYLSRKSNSLTERSQRLFDADSAATSNSQAQSAGRLTVVASIFLPLTLAASLLAMNAPAASLGRLWYDFIGMVICIGFICFSSLSVYRRFQHSQQSNSSRIGVFNLFSRAIDTATEYQSSQISESISTLLLWGVPAVIAASFLAGMFSSFDLALKALEYGLPILFAFFVISLAFRIARYSSPTRDCYRTVRYVEKVIENRKGESSGSSTLLEPSLSKKAYNRDLKALLAAILKASQELQINKPADPKEPLVELIHRFCEEAKHVSDVDYIRSKAKDKKSNSH